MRRLRLPPDLDGRGAVATTLFGTAFVGERQLWRIARDATVDTFQQLVPDLRLEDPEPLGGYGALLAPPRLVDAAGRWYVGEAAGIEDAEWGIGIMTALESGVRAASTAIAGDDYGHDAQRDFTGRRATSLANRGLAEAMPIRLLDAALDHGCQPTGRAGAPASALGAEPGQVDPGASPPAAVSGRQGLRIGLVPLSTVRRRGLDGME